MTLDKIECCVVLSFPGALTLTLITMSIFAGFAVIKDSLHLI
jgi:hypothetical protein